MPSRKEVPAVAKESRKLIAKNSKAFHDYFVEDRYEAGIELAAQRSSPSARGT